MRASAAQDRRLLAELAERYGPAVRAYFRRRVASSADVEDLCQDVFLRLLKRADLQAIDNPEGFIFQVAANVLRNRFRDDGARVTATEPGLEDEDERFSSDEPSPERVLLGREAYARMVTALQALPERSRMIFILSRYEHLTAREIATRLGISVSYAEKELFRAVAYLRDALR